MQFKRDITSLGLLFAGISSVIGSGWLFGPLFAAQVAGPAALLSWIIGGTLMIIIALTFAELGTAFPVAGGMIEYAQRSHGHLMSFVTGWMVWISSVAVAPVETMGLLQYAANYLPGIMRVKANTHVLTHTGILAAAGIMFLMCYFNYHGARFFSRSNSIITAIKLIVPISTACLLLLTAFHPTNFTAADGFLPYGWHGVFAALPLGGVIYSFIGSNTILQLAGETKNPQRSIPLALIGSMLFCMLLYGALQAAFIGALTPASLINGWKALHFVGDSGPFSGIMAALGLSWFVIIIYGDAIISPFGTGYVFTASTARVTYGLSNIGFLPAIFKKLSDKSVPLYAISLNYVVGLLLFLPFPVWQKLVSFIISCFIISYIIGPISLIALRKANPNLPRPFKLPCATAIALLAFYICNLLIIWTGWETVYHMMIALSIGLIFYVLYCFRIENKNLREEWRCSWWIIPYFIALTVISYFSSFGNGTNAIPFGIDFLVIAILTVVVFYFAVKTAYREEVR